MKKTKQPEIDQELFRHAMGAVAEAHQQYRAAQRQGNLVAWLTDERLAPFFGKTLILKFQILAALSTGTSMADVARRNGVSRQAVSKLAKKAKSALSPFS